jgi:hypothetical protein
MHRVIRYGAAILVFGCGILIRPLYGCTCVEPASIKAAQDAVDVVFLGTITGRSDGFRRAAVFRVSQVWKGRVSEQFRIEWKIENGDCSGFRKEDLQVGAELLVFAKRGSDGIYRTSICYSTKRAADAAAEIAQLGRGERPVRN